MRIVPVGTQAKERSQTILMYVFMKSNLLRCGGLDMTDIGQLCILLLLEELLKKDIIQSEEQAIVSYHWAKEL